MGKLKCELCGSENIIKQDDVFVCQDCGCKYSLEQAKKIMSASSVNTASEQKSISNNTSSQSERMINLYKLARRARDNNDYESAERYYSEILLDNPNDWEAAFYTVYCKAYTCKIAEIKSAAVSISNCLNTILNLIKDYTPKEEKLDAVIDVVAHCNTIARMLSVAAVNHYVSASNNVSSSTLNGVIINIQYKQEYVDRSCACCNICYFLGNYIDELFPDRDEYHALCVSAWKCGITIHVNIMSLLNDKKFKESNKDTILLYGNKIQKYDSSYQIPEINKSKHACYIATCVYGSYDCPQVWTLRRYRDNVLALTCRGRAFIHLYYAVGPIIVKLFGKSKCFNKICKNKLDNMVEKLNKQGVEDTPYDDIDW